jgi:hypothetical protein
MKKQNEQNVMTRKAPKLHFNNSNITRKKTQNYSQIINIYSAKIVYAPMSPKNINVCNEKEKEGERVIHEENN